VKPYRIPFLLFALVLCAPSLAADDAALLRCRALTDTARRLACYDALPLEGSKPAPSAPSAGGAAPATPSAPSLLARFGFEQRAQPEELPSIASSIPGEFEGWGPATRIKLANGQVWQIADGSSRKVYLDNPKVTVRRGALGSFFLDFENANWSPRVRRVQ
jgi:hypothetical protein